MSSLCYSLLARSIAVGGAFAASALLLRAADSPPIAEPVTELDKVEVTGSRLNQSTVTAATLPVTATVSASRLEDTVNLVDTEDAVKYFPSVFLRKRNYGDTQAVMATRVWGVSSSARSLIFADGVPLTALIANNNTIGGPRWGLVAPAEIARVDMMYGPFSAAYAGNSMGAVMEITTRQPEKFEASLDQTVAFQNHRLYGTKDTYATYQTALTVGDRVGKFSFWVSANYQDSESHPLSYVTSTTFPAATTGGYAALNKLGAPANILGSSGLLHTKMSNFKVKAAYDLTPILRAAYTFGWWKNNAASRVETYLRNAAGNPTFAGQAGFATGTYKLLQQHSSQSLSVRTDTKSAWNFEAVATLYRFDKDRQRSPSASSLTNAASLGFGTPGRVALLDGTGWSTLDLKGIWRPDGKTGAHTVSFGVHDDHYHLFNPTYNTSDWGPGGPNTSVATEGDGKTRTQALWIQDNWQIAPSLKATYGVRYEEWHAYDGYNANGTSIVKQPSVNARNGSPKATLAWELAPHWTVTGSVAQAYRYATASELYQLISTGTTFTSPNPNLKPDEVLAAEVRLEYTTERGSVRLSAFQDDVHDAIIAQFKPLLPNSTQLFSFVSNVDHVRARGLELVLQRNNLFVHGLEFSGSATYLDAKTLATSGFAGTTGASAIGKKLPNIPEWRATFLFTYRPNQRWALSLGGRYSSLLYTTLDNADVNPNTYQGFSGWFVADVHANYRINAHWNASLGVDNVLDRKYFLFHPFPQRTVVARVRYLF